MIREITAYATLVLDCDGVVLDSNRIKTEAFRTAAAQWGQDPAEELVAHHVANGGISRYAKFEYFIEHILPKHVPGGVPEQDGPGPDALLAEYAKAVRTGLRSCAVADGLPALRRATPKARWLLASGGDQAELREIFAARDLDGYFNGGIFGSPDTKSAIVGREIRSGRITFPALLLGDSRLDHEVAQAYGLDFTFVYGWTEFADWRAYCANNEIKHIASLESILSNSAAIFGQ